MAAVLRRRSILRKPVNIGFQLFVKEKRRLVHEKLAIPIEAGAQGKPAKNRVVAIELAALWKALEPDEREAWNDLAQNWCEFYDRQP